LSNPAQQCVAAGGQSELGPKAHASTAAERQAQGGQPGIQAPRPARPGKGNCGQTLGKNAALAAAIPAEQAAHPQPDSDGVRALAPGQIGEHALVSAVDALGPPAAEWAAGRDPTRLKGEDDRRSNGIKMPGFKPNVGPVRQKVREKVHSLYLATLAPSSKLAKSPLNLQNDTPKD
jgi:hypothetical protein